jgi:MFS family permease
MVDLGDRFTGALLLAGNSAFGVMWGLGGIIGPSVAGVAMDLVGPEGLPLTLGALFVILGPVACLMPLNEVERIGNIRTSNPPQADSTSNVE